MELELQIDPPVLLIQLLGIKSRACTNAIYSIRVRRKITISTNRGLTAFRIAMKLRNVTTD
jgi:hypothetical protein